MPATSAICPCTPQRTPRRNGKFRAPATPTTPATRGNFATPKTPATTAQFTVPSTPESPFTEVSSGPTEFVVPVVADEVLMTKKERMEMMRARGLLQKEMPKLAKTAPVSRQARRLTKPKWIKQNGETVALESPKYDKKITYSFFEQCFRIITLLGAGSFGEVFAVRSEEDNKDYAIKASLQLVSERSSVKYREVVNHMKLPKHPNVVDFKGAWVEDGRMFIQQELCTRNLLSMLIEKHGLPEEHVWNIAVDLVQGVHHLHTNKILHADIKPENIFLTAEGICKIGDFGLAVDLNKNDELKNAEDGDSRYLAPEVLNNGPSMAGDVFSLGVTILEAATGMFIPNNGTPWKQLRSGIIPARFFENKTTMLRKFIKEMILETAKDRPSAKQLLGHPEIAKRIGNRMELIKSAKAVESVKTSDELLFRLDQECLQLPNDLTQSHTINALMERRSFTDQGSANKSRFADNGKLGRCLFGNDDELSNSCPPIIRNGKEYGRSPIKLDFGDDEDKLPVPAKRLRRQLNFD